MITKKAQKPNFAGLTPLQSVQKSGLRIFTRGERGNLRNRQKNTERSDLKKTQETSSGKQ